MSAFDCQCFRPADPEDRALGETAYHYGPEKCFFEYIFSLRLIGRRVNLHPVWMMFALFAFGWLFGFVGVLLAIPLAASLGVILRFARRQSLAGKEYIVDPPPPRGPV